MADSRPLTEVHSAVAAAELLRSGWRLVSEFRTHDDAEPYEWVFEWPGPGPVPLRGRGLHLGLSILPEHIAEAQREAWAAFPPDVDNP